MAAIGFVGLVAFPFLPVAPLPQVDFPTIQVNATLHGASAETMAASVAAPLERQFGQIPGVTQLTSMSATDATSITIQFALDRNIDSAAQDVQAAITVASKTLPREMSTPPSYKKVNPADSSIMMLAARSDTLPLYIVDDYVDNFLAQQISQVPGVAQATIGGDQKPSIRVQVDPAKLASSGLTLEEVRSTLVTSTTIAAKGTVNTTRTSFTIAANDQISDAEPFNDIVLAYRNGGPIRVRDVGQAIAAASDRTVAGYQNGQRGILLQIFKQPGANVIEIVDKVKEMLPRLTARIPPAIDVDRSARSHHHHPRLRRGRRIHADADDRAGGAGDIAVPAQFLGDVHSRRDGAAGAARLVRIDVSAQFQPRQSLVDGADHRGRLRGR